MLAFSAARPASLRHAELEAELHRLLGRTVVACSTLDLVVALCIAAQTHQSHAPKDIDALTISEKLAELQLLLSARSLPPESRTPLANWFTRARCLRQLRNSFVHGRWGTASETQELCFVPAGLPSLGAQVLGAEQRYTLSALTVEVAEIESLAGQLVGFRRKYAF